MKGKVRKFKVKIKKGLFQAVGLDPHEVIKEFHFLDFD